MQIHRIRIIELFRLKRTFNDHLVYLPCHWLGCISLDQIAQSFVQPGFECLQWQGIHSSSGSMFHCLTIFTIKIFFLTFLTLSLKPSPLVLSLGGFPSAGAEVLWFSGMLCVSLCHGVNQDKWKYMSKPRPFLSTACFKGICPTHRHTMPTLGLLPKGN